MPKTVACVVISIALIRSRFMCVWSGSTLFGLACLALYLELLRYITKTYLVYNFGDGWVRQRLKVSCVLRHWGVQLILVYNWARPSILVSGKGREEMFLFLLFLHFHSCSPFFRIPFFHLFFYLFYLFSPFLWETTQNDSHGLTCR